MTHAAPTMPDYLTVRELAALLRIKERKVYELASSGAVPVTRVTGKLLFPEQEIRAWIAAGQSGGEPAASVAAPADRPAIFLGSHDPLLEWAIRQSRCGLATRFDGSFDGLDRFATGEGVACGLHLQDAETGDWNLPAVAPRFAGANAVLLHWVRRSRGLVVRSSDAGAVRSIADLAGRRIAARPAETGTQALFDRLAGEAGLGAADLTVAEVAPSEADAAQAVAQGGADAAFGLAAFARLYNLAFVPVVDEAFDLLIDRKSYFEAPLQRLIAFAQGAEFRARAGETAGYDARGLGTVRWNA
jgi:excisionase family DNA binding protein